MTKWLILFILFSSFIDCYAQKNELEKVIFDFKMFKYPDTEYQIDIEKNELTCYVMYGRERRDTLFSKTYNFGEKDSKKLTEALNRNIPDSIITIGEDGFDGGRFIITYFKKGGGTSKLSVSNAGWKPEKYTVELNMIDVFFDFAYSIVKDPEGINVLDNSYAPVYRGLPIRKISDKPLQYKIWGSISGGISDQPQLLNFLNSLPKNKEVIIDCNDKLSYKLLNDIQEIFEKNTHIKLINNRSYRDE